MADKKVNKSNYSFLCPLRVRYAEVDAQGIVFNAHYLFYFDLAITEYFRSRGLAYTAFSKRYGLDFHVTRSTVNYRAPARFDEELAIGVRGAYRAARVYWDIAIFRGDDNLCAGELVYATVDATTRRVKKIDTAATEFLGLEERTPEQGD